MYQVQILYYRNNSRVQFKKKKKITIIFLRAFDSSNRRRARLLYGETDPLVQLTPTLISCVQLSFFRVPCRQSISILNTCPGHAGGCKRFGFCGNTAVTAKRNSTPQTHTVKHYFIRKECIICAF